MPNQCYTIVRRANSIKVETCLFLIRWRVCQVILLAISFNLWPQRLSFTRLLGSHYSSGVRGWFAALQLRADTGAHMRRLRRASACAPLMDGGTLLFGDVPVSKTQFFVLARTQHISLDVDYVWFLHPVGSLIESHYQKWSDSIAAARRWRHKNPVRGPCVRGLLYM